MHLIWTIKASNGKESPSGSFAKFTAHQFKKLLQATNQLLLNNYQSEKRDRSYQFWKRDPLAIPLSTEKILLQKLDYIHNNPLKENWQLCRLPEEYKWSSARFYLSGYDEFGLLTHFRD